MNSTDAMKIAAFQELKDALTVKKVNDELLEFLASSLRWLLHYGERHNMPIPEKDKIIELMDRAMEIAKKLPSQYISDDFLQRDKNKDNRRGLDRTALKVPPPRSKISRF
jgi:hypothetical protein